MTFTVTLGKRPEYTPEEIAQRARRAAELLDGCGWVFDEHISSLTQQMLDTDPADTAATGELHRSIRAAAELKGRLMHTINSKLLEDRRDERRDRNADG